MTKKQYSEEFKEQLIKESQEVGNIALVVADITYHLLPFILGYVKLKKEAQ